ncbi:MAG: hypothetical protein WD066_19200, partial [Planctomycetaceae bacterium]
MMRTPAPAKETLWRHAILGGLANGIATLQHLGFEATQYWDGHHFKMNGGDGREGIITFAGGHWYEEAPLVGVFHDVHSSRNPFRDPEWSVDRFFHGCPEFQRGLAEQAALTFLRLVTNGRIDHRVTAAFWDRGGRLIGADDWKVLLENGTSLIELELIEDDDAAIEALAEDYGLSGREVRIITSAYKRKLRLPSAPVRFSGAEAKKLGSSPESVGRKCCFPAPLR